MQNIMNMKTCPKSIRRERDETKTLLFINIYADTLRVSSGALIEVTLLFRYSTTDREATRVLALFGHLSEWQFN